MFNDLSRMGKYLGQAARMLVGMPDYDPYVEHMRTKHPDQPVMTSEEFFRERQEVRYGGGKGRPIRCC
ncbi:YbdD/YjiX family protein [Pseudomonas aeruginosa]